MQCRVFEQFCLRGQTLKSHIKDHAFRNLFLVDGLNPMCDCHLGRLIGTNLTEIRRL